MMIKKKTSTNASASLAGWDFQINAAIVLLMLNLKEAKAVKVEGGVEDIEITLNDNSKIYSQAKHVAKPDNYSTVRSHLINALRTLNTASLEDNINQLIYVTNSPNPFSEQSTMPFFISRTELEYEELPQKCKTKIIKIMSEYDYNDLKLNKLSVHVIPFYGKKENNKYKVVRSVVEETLAKLDIHSAGVIYKILHIWQRYFFQNATEELIDVILSKRELLWALIVILMEEFDSIKYKIDYSEDDLQFVKNRYVELINYQTLNFELITRVLSDYNNNKKPVTKFIDEYWKNYIDIVETLDDDSETLTLVVKIILFKILSQREAINKIKVEVGL